MSDDPKKKKRSRRTKKNRRRSSAFTKAKKLQRKIVIIGSTRSGKTALVRRFCDNRYTEEYNSTVEDLFYRNYKYRVKHFSLQIIDMASPFQFPAMRDLHVQAADVVMLVYEIDDKASTKEAGKAFEMIYALRPDVPVVLVGTKQDVVSTTRQNSEDYMDSFYGTDITANSHILTSAKDDVGVKEAFEMCLDELMLVAEQKIAKESGRKDSTSSGSSTDSNDSKHCIIL